MLPWAVSAAAWQHAQGIHQPHIGEISPVQYARLSGRSRRSYDAERHAEWDASANVKREYARLVLEAHDAGTFALGDTDVHPDAERAVRAAHRARVQAEQAARWEQAQADNQLSIAEISVGDRVWVVMGGHYGTVTKVSKKSIRVKCETAYLKDKPPMLVRAGCVRRLSHDDLKGTL